MLLPKQVQCLSQAGQLRVALRWSRSLLFDGESRAWNPVFIDSRTFFSSLLMTSLMMLRLQPLAAKSKLPQHHLRRANLGAAQPCNGMLPPGGEGSGVALAGGTWPGSNPCLWGGSLRQEGGRNPPGAFPSSGRLSSGTGEVRAAGLLSPVSSLSLSSLGPPLRILMCVLLHRELCCLFQLCSIGTRLARRQGLLIALAPRRAL